MNELFKLFELELIIWLVSMNFKEFNLLTKMWDPKIAHKTDNFLFELSKERSYKFIGQSISYSLDGVMKNFSKFTSLGIFLFFNLLLSLPLLFQWIDSGQSDFLFYALFCFVLGILMAQSFRDLTK